MKIKKWKLIASGLLIFALGNGSIGILTFVIFSILITITEINIYDRRE